jgi:type II secretory pathway pseudopilin PulG
MNYEKKHSVMSERGFSLIEVVLAIGIFLVTVLALVGLLGPTLRSVNEVEKTDEVSSIVNTINAFLQSSPAIAPGGSNFNAIYTAVTVDESATLLVFRAYDNNDVISLKIGFVGETGAMVSASDVVDSAGEILAAGTVYRAVLTASSVNPSTEMNGPAALGVYPQYSMIIKNPLLYPEGSFAMEVRIFAEEPSSAFVATSVLTELALEEPIFTYNTAIVR